MIYTIKSAEAVTTTTGKPMKKLSMVGTDEIVVSVNIFSDFPHYADITVGSSIDGELKKNDKGYTNLYSNEIKTRGAAPSAFKQKVIEETMQRKETSIGKFQDNKELSIKVASTMNKAVELAIAEIRDIKTLNTLEQDILKWREWLWNNWDVGSTQYPPSGV